jgi:hypothetical protein
MTNDITKYDDIIDLRDVIARVEELREQRVPRYLAGWNMPGYMPDSPPEQFDDADDARAYLTAAMRDEAEQDDERVDNPDQAYAQALTDAADALDSLATDQHCAEYGQTVGRYHYLLTFEGMAGLDDDEQAELAELEALLDDCRGYGGDEQWEGDWYPVTLIRESHFTDYAQELAEDIGAVTPDASWPNNCIDWEKAARELLYDYTAVDFDGVCYYTR